MPGRRHLWIGVGRIERFKRDLGIEFEGIFEVVHVGGVYLSKSSEFMV